MSPPTVYVTDFLGKVGIETQALDGLVQMTALGV